MLNKWSHNLKISANSLQDITKYIGQCNGLMPMSVYECIPINMFATYRFLKSPTFPVDWCILPELLTFPGLWQKKVLQKAMLRTRNISGDNLLYVENVANNCSISKYL